MHGAIFESICNLDRKKTAPGRQAALQGHKTTIRCRQADLRGCRPPVLSESWHAAFTEQVPRPPLRMCRYVNGKAQRFVLQRSGAAWVLTGCSGHGFKFGPLMGLGLAAMVGGGIAEDAATRWAAGELPGMPVPGLDMPYAAAPFAAG